MRHGENGFVFSEGNLVEAAHFVAHLNRNREYLNRVSSNAYRSIKEEFDLDESVRDYLGAFHTVMNSRIPFEPSVKAAFQYSRLDNRYIPNWFTRSIRKLLMKEFIIKWP
jgi:hypothetical protein